MKKIVLIMFVCLAALYSAFGVVAAGANVERAPVLAASSGVDSGEEEVPVDAANCEAFCSNNLKECVQGCGENADCTTECDLDFEECVGGCSAQ